MIGNAVMVGLLGLGWGLNWPAVRLALQELQPWTLRAVGFTAASLLLFIVIRLTGQSARVPRRHWLRLAAIGALSVVAYNLFSAFAQLSASTTRSAVLSYTMPVWTVIAARIVLGEPIDRRRILGLALGGAGLVALGWPIVQAGEFSRGLVFAVGSGVVWAIGSVMLKRYPIEAAPIVITAWQIALGALVTSAGMLGVEGVPHALPTRPSTWAGLAYNIVIGQAFSTALWFTILGRMPAGIASIASLLVPGVGVIGAATIIGEHPTAADWIGLGLIVAASAAVVLPSGPRTSGRNPSVT